MTQKVKSKPKRPAAPKLAAVSVKAKAANLEAENAALLEQLALAERRITDLELQRDEALNRIEWVIDAINSLTEGVR